MKKKWLAGLLLAAVLTTGCTADGPKEEAAVLTGNGFTANYHQSMWTRLSENEAEQTTELTYSHTETDAFFALVRLDAETAAAQGIASPESIETLLQTYVTNYGGGKETIAAKDTDTEYVRTLTFSYDDTEMNTPYTYLAKIILHKESGEMLAVLAAYPNNSGKPVKTELSMIVDSASVDSSSIPPDSSSVPTESESTSSPSDSSSVPPDSESVPADSSEPVQSEPTEEETPEEKPPFEMLAIAAFTPQAEIFEDGQAKLSVTLNRDDVAVNYQWQVKKAAKVPSCCLITQTTATREGVLTEKAPLKHLASLPRPQCF